jgi:hypothetical protein
MRRIVEVWLGLVSRHLLSEHGRYERTFTVSQWTALKKTI